MPSPGMMWRPWMTSGTWSSPGRWGSLGRQWPRCPRPALDREGGTPNLHAGSYRSQANDSPSEPWASGSHGGRGNASDCRRRRSGLRHERPREGTRNLSTASQFKVSPPARAGLRPDGGQSPDRCPAPHPSQGRPCPKVGPRLDHVCAPVAGERSGGPSSDASRP